MIAPQQVIPTNITTTNVTEVPTNISQIPEQNVTCAENCAECYQGGACVRCKNGYVVYNQSDLTVCLWLG